MSELGAMAKINLKQAGGINPLAWAWRLAGQLLDLPFRAIQRAIGARNMAYVFLVPNLVVFGLFSFWPMILNFYIAFTGGSAITILDRPLVGLDNFRELLDCPSWLDPKTCPVAGYSFWTSLWNTLFFAVIQVPVMIGVALLTAIVLNRDIVARGFWRAVFFYPVMLSPVVIAVTWDWILKRRGILNALIGDFVEGWNGFVLHPAGRWLVLFLVALVLGGLMTRLLTRILRIRRFPGLMGMIVAVLLLAGGGLLPASALQLPDFRPINWLVDARSGWPTFWVIFIYTWGHLGFFMLILLAGLQAIPKDLYEAAQMDGTPQWRQFWRITLPLLAPTMVVVLVLSLIRAFQVFDEVYVLTGGGPGQATKMLIQHIYESAFTGDAKRYGIAAASSVLMAGLILLLTLIQLVANRRKAGA